MSATSPEQARTIESDALIDASPDIAERLARDVNLQSFAHKCLRAKLITQSTMDDCFEERDESAIARCLLSAITDNVRVSPKNFESFLLVLDQEVALKVPRKNLINTYGKGRLSHVHAPTHSHASLHEHIYIVASGGTCH